MTQPEKPREFSDHPFWHTPPQSTIGEQTVLDIIDYRATPSIDIVVGGTALKISPAEAEQMYFHLKAILGVEN